VSQSTVIPKLCDLESTELPDFDNLRNLAGFQTNAKFG